MNAPRPASAVSSNLLLLRVLVGFLGQRRQSDWWDCSFLDPVGLRFLETTFPRTAPKAAIRSTTEAAARVHDEGLGRIGSYHLFRLPGSIEDAIEHELASLEWARVSRHLQSTETALAELVRLRKAMVKVSPGPVQIGVEKKILTVNAVEELAAHYHSAFQDRIRCFPYFSASPHGR